MKIDADEIAETEEAPKKERWTPGMYWPNYIFAGAVGVYAVTKLVIGIREDLRS
jgi:hypothetical protein